MEEKSARAIEVKAHKREVRKPVLSGNLPVKEKHLYPESVQDNPDYVEIGTEVTDKVAGIDIRTWLVYVLGRIPSYKSLWCNLLPAHWVMVTITSKTSLLPQ